MYISQKIIEILTVICNNRLGYYVEVSVLHSTRNDESVNFSCLVQNKTNGILNVVNVVLPLGEEL